ncbi:MAG: peptidylprolyl isomerase [Bacteroidales bacterium]|nr:peptidylprolyl isomerase [Bacteroidales bacterium]
MKKSLLILATLVAATCYSQDKPNEERTMILISTSFGDIKAVLYDETPQHRDNFIKLVNEGWYEGSPFHRIIKGFMIQGGQNADGRLDPGYKVPAEFVPGLFHKKGALAAARQADQVNPEKASSGSQFYIVQGKTYTDADLYMMGANTGREFSSEEKKAYIHSGGTPFLDGAYTVFGEVVDGMDVIDKIASVKTDASDRPVEPVTMTIKILE